MSWVIENIVMFFISLVFKEKKELQVENILQAMILIDFD